MTARELVDALGDKLVGKIIDTAAMGDYPGGLAEVIAILPDPGAPEIVFQVRHPTFGEIGVFDFEPVGIIL